MLQHCKPNHCCHEIRNIINFTPVQNQTLTPPEQTSMICDVSPSPPLTHEISLQDMSTLSKQYKPIPTASIDKNLSTRSRTRAQTKACNPCDDQIFK